MWTYLGHGLHVRQRFREWGTPLNFKAERRTLSFIENCEDDDNRIENDCSNIKVKNSECKYKKRSKNVACVSDCSSYSDQLSH